MDGIAARMMLPWVLGGPVPPIIFAARADGAPVPLGVAALVPAVAHREPHGFRFDVAVAPPYRRGGVGRALVAAVAAEARRWEVGGLWAWERVPEDAGGAFLRALGFRCAKRFLHFEADPARLHAVVAPIRDRMERERRLPSGVRVVPLVEAPAAQVVSFYQRYLGGDAAALAERVAGRGPGAFSPEHSMVLMAGATVGGIALCGWREDGAGTIAGFALDPEWRRSAGAAAVLMATALGLGLETGCRRMHFSCWEDVRDMVKLASRSDGRLVGWDAQYVLDLDA